MVKGRSIDIKALCFRIGSFIMQDVTFQVHGGEYFVLTGPNGAGKSLLMKLICGLHHPLSGSICIDDHPLDGTPPWRRQIGYVPQDGVLFPNRSVSHNIGFGLEVRGMPRRERDTIIHRMTDLLHITHLLDRLPHGLSGGERQKVSLARALVFEPDVLLLDEPVSAIDEQARDEVCQELYRIQRTLGVTTLHISHNPLETNLLADRVGVLDQGRLLQVTSGNKGTV
ncbi:MAG: ATP-binding cassette domain-containing protein [Phycisphaerae bacterium]|nr:ATP-binding cassette domain-containing protein [Phycisphaerae bacterium]